MLNPVPCDCRMAIITKSSQVCCVRTTVILLLLIMLQMLPGLSIFTQYGHMTTTEVIITYARSAVRISCWKSNSWPTLCHRTRSDKPFAVHFVCYFAPAIVSEVFIWYHSLFVTFMFVLSWLVCFLSRLWKMDATIVVKLTE